MKLIKKISAITLGVAMAAGVGATFSKSAKEVKAAAQSDVTAKDTTTANWSKVTKAADISVDSDYILGFDYDSKVYYLLGNTTSSGVNTTNTITDAVVYNVVKTEEHYLINKKGFTTSGYLTNGSSGNMSFGVGTEFDFFAESTGVISNPANSSRFLGGNNSSPVRVKAYAAGNVSTYPNVYLYKYVSAADIVHVTSVSLDINEKTILTGESFDLTETVLPSNATDSGVTWSSSNEEVATVENGHVQGLSVGEATITADTNDGHYKATCVVTVNKNPYDFDTLTNSLFNATGTSYTEFENKKSISKASYYGSTNKQNDSFAMKKDGSSTGVYTKTTGGLIKSISVEMGSSSSASATYAVYGSNEPITSFADLFGLKTTLIASTNESKTVEPDSNYQFFGIRSTNGSPQIKSVVVKWEPVKPTSITVEHDSIELTVDGTANIVPTLANGDLIVSETEVEYSSDNAAVTVDATGRVVAVSEGTANITIKSKADNAVTKTVAVTVSGDKTPVLSVSLDKTEVTIKETHTETLTATVLPEDATVKTVTWTSSDETVATVDKDGVVTALKAGSATIKVESTDDNTKYAECAVTVEERETTQLLLVENSTYLIEGARYMIAGTKDKSMYLNGVQKGNNVPYLESQAFEFEDNVDFSLDAVTEEIESSFITLLKDENGNWMLSQSSKYLYAAGGSSNNYLKLEDTPSENAKFDISFDEHGLISVVAQGEAVNKYLRFNSASKLFSCYGYDSEKETAKQSPIYFYLVDEQEGSAEVFAESFMAATNMVCLASEEEVPHYDALVEQWDGFASSFSELGDEEKAKFLEASPSALLNAMLERYDYLVAKYGLTNFIGHEVAPLNNIYRPLNTNNDNAIVIIAVVSVVSITTLAVLMIVKRRKAINK